MPSSVIINFAKVEIFLRDLELHVGYLINGSCNSKGDSFSQQVTTLLGFLIMGLLGEKILCI